MQNELLILMKDQIELQRASEGADCWANICLSFAIGEPLVGVKEKNGGITLIPFTKGELETFVMMLNSVMREDLPESFFSFNFFENLKTYNFKGDTANLRSLISKLNAKLKAAGASCEIYSVRQTETHPGGYALSWK